MPVSKREFFDMPYWKEKRYNNVVIQSGKNPADFEAVEWQDIQNYELQQAISSINNCGFIADGFKVKAISPEVDDKVYIYKGRGWIQANVGSEFSGIRLELPDVLTTTPTLKYEDHDTLGGSPDPRYIDPNYTFPFILNDGPNYPDYRYDLIYIEFYRLEYTASGVIPPRPIPPSGDSEMQDPVLGETAHREKWYYEFKYMDGLTLGDPNPSLPSLPAGHYGIKLAVVRRQKLKNIIQDDIIDVRPKFSLGGNMVSDNVILVGSKGGRYNSLLDVVNNPTGINPITPSATNPFIISLLPGVHTCNFPIDIGTMGYIKIVGCGIDKTILEFEDIYTLTPSQWINIGSASGIEFANLTIRIKSGYTGDKILININGGTVRFDNCKLGDTPTGMLYQNLAVNNGTIIIRNCEIQSRSATYPCISLSGTTKMWIYNSIIKQSQYKTIKNDIVPNGLLRIYNSEIIGNGELLYMNGVSEYHDCLISKEEWVGDTTMAGNSVRIMAPSKMYSCMITGPSGKNIIQLEDPCDFYNCYHDDIITYNDAGLARFFGCSLTILNASNGATPELYGCDIMTSSSISVTLTGALTSAKFIDCEFKRDGICISSTDAILSIRNCGFAVTGAVKVIDLLGICSPIIQNCKFQLDNAGATGIYMEVDTAKPVVTHCVAIGNVSAKIFDAVVNPTTIEAGDIDGNVTLKGGFVTITDIRLA